MEATMRRKPYSTFRIGVLILLICGLFCGFALAQQEDRQTLELKLGGSDIIKTAYPFKRVSIADPSIADVVVLSPREIYVFGKKPGYTSMVMWDEGKGKSLLDVVVSIDLTALKEKVHSLYPDQDIKIHGSERGVVLSGTVSGPEVVEQVLRLTQNYLPKVAEGGKSGEGTGRSGSGITNLLKVGGIQQVMLEVKFAEVRRDKNKDWEAAFSLAKLGNDFAGASAIGGLGDLSDGGVGAATGSLFVNFADMSGSGNGGTAANIFTKIDNVTAALRFLEGEGLARLLAEPRLVTQSGQEASFLAGGEFPIPQVNEDGSPDVEFKEFGVGLVFTPVVLSDGKISLRVAPSVSNTTVASIIPTGVGNNAFVVPSLNTRKLETAVQLYDGQTLALAGLLQDNIVESVSKIPGLGDIPILGALFRSTSFQQEKTDLLITVTPHLVKPVKEGSMTHPGEYFQTPNGFEFYLEGRLEGRRSSDDSSGLIGHDFSAALPEPQGGLEGEFGYQPVSDTTKGDPQ